MTSRKLRVAFIIKIFVVCFCGIQQINAQIIKDSLNILETVDTLFVDRDFSNYSLRVFTNYKGRTLKLKDDNSKSRFVPNNRHGIGIGVANSKMVLDIAFNLKTKKKNATKRFDMQGATILGKHNYVNFYLQSYKGFLAKNDFGEPSIFRSDIKSLTAGFNYLYTLSEIEFSYSLLKAGLARKHKNVYITGGLGVFAFFDYFSANGAILPQQYYQYYSEQAQIKRYKGMGVGLLGGLLSVFVLPKNIIASCNLMPGVALINNQVVLNDDDYRPKKPMLYKLDFTLSLGYNFKRFYVNLSYGGATYFTKLGYGNKYQSNISNAKLAVGYKLKKKRVKR
ncbi:DUF4421 family protein [Mangrovimonas spongiae]|uniref:DUF4421 family protein n=1 Tax=Mangrovimonas spongiae TaxID=2494697 RepID=UPI001F0CCE8A|nr:DUF4421 family protein [Mangrovimonas spongiae]